MPLTTEASNKNRALSMYQVVKNTPEGSETPTETTGTTESNFNASQHTTEEKPKVRSATTRVSARSSFTVDNVLQRIRTARSSFDKPEGDNPHRSTTPTNRGSDNSLNLRSSTKSTRSSFNVDGDGQKIRTARNSFEKSERDGPHRSTTPTNRGSDTTNHSRPSTRESIKSTRSSRSSFGADGDGRTARNSFDKSEIDGNDEWYIRDYVDAVLNGNLDVVKYLVELHKIDLNSRQVDDFNALFAACGEGHLSLVNYLLSKGSNVNFVAPMTNYSPLHAAAVDGNVEVLEALLIAGAHINSVNINGWTSLWKATRSGQVEAVQLLIDRGADIELADTLGMTALHAACLDGNFDIVKMLLEHGAKVNVLTMNGETPYFLCATNFSWIAERGNLACLLILKEFGADVDRPDGQGKTPEAAADELLQPFFRLGHLTSDDPKCLDLLKDDEYHLWFALISANCKSVFVKELIELHPSLEDCRDARGRIAYDVASPLMKEAFGRTPLLSNRSGKVEVVTHCLSPTRPIFNLALVCCLSHRVPSIKARPTSNVNNVPLHMLDGAADPLDDASTNEWSTKTPAEKETELRTLARDGELTDSLVAMMSGTDLNCVDSYGWTPVYEGDPFPASLRSEYRL